MIIQETPTLNLQFDKAKNDSDMLSLLKSQGGTFTRGSEVVGSGASVASYVDALGTLRYAKLGHPRPNFVDGVNQGLLIEEARTNLLQRSEEFDNAYWTKGSSTVTSASINTPYNTVGAFNLVKNNTVTDAFIERTFSTGSVATHSCSWIVKKKDYSEIDVMAVHIGESSSTSVIRFNFDNGSFNTASSGRITNSFVKTLKDGWFYITIVFSTTASATSIRTRLYPSEISVVGDGTSGTYIFASQTEAGSFPTSYIPTAGTTVTRGADNASIEGTAFTDFYNQDEGTFVVEFQNFGNVSGLTISAVYGVSDNTNNNRFSARVSNITQENVLIVASSVIQTNLINADSYNAIGTNKNVIGFETNNLKSYSNGVLTITDDSLTLPLVDRLFIGKSQGVNQSRTVISKLIFYPKNLSDADKQLLSRI